MTEDIFENIDNTDAVTIEIDVVEPALAELVTEVDALGNDVPVSTVEESVPFEVSIEEFAGASTSTNIVTNHTSSGPNQHTIGAITGLREELDDIKKLQTIYSNHKYHANYFMWEKIPANAAGLFVAACNGVDKIRVCTSEDDVFGVTVPTAAFIGGQSDMARDDSYGLVINAGLASVQCESDVTVGDYVVPNDRGQAQKSGGTYGYLVTGLDILDGVQCAVISLTPSSILAQDMSNAVHDLSGRMNNAEQNIASVGNVANSAYALAQSTTDKAFADIGHLNKQTEELTGKTDESEARIDDLTEIVNKMVPSIEEAKSAANNAASSAESIRNEAIAAANDALAMAKINEANLEAYNTIVANIDKYTVGEYSQAYGLTWQQAKDILEVDMIYVPVEGNSTDVHSETYSNGADDYTQQFLRSCYYTWTGTIWLESNANAVIFIQDGQYIGGSIMAPYLVVQNENVMDESGHIYEKDMLYKWTRNEESKIYSWMPITSISKNVLNRTVALIRHDVDSIGLEVTNVVGDVASHQQWLDNNSANIQDVVSWHSDNGDSLVTFMQEAEDNFASASQVAQVVDKDGNITAASIVALVNNGESSVTIDADHINFAADNYTIHADKINFEGSQFSSTMSQTYSTKDEMNAAKDAAITAANNSTDEKLKGYSTTTEMNSAINQKADSIALSVSQTYSTKDETQGLIDDIEIGGRNLACSDSISHTATVNADRGNSWNITKDNAYFGTKISEEIFETGETYTLSFYLQKTDGALKNIGGHTGGYTFLSQHIDGESVSGYGSGIAVSDDTSRHYIVLTFKANKNATDNNFYIQPNRSDATSVTYDLWNIKVERGNKATDWTPAPEDMATAAELQITKDSMVAKVYTAKTGDNCSWTMTPESFNIAAVASDKEGGITVDANGLTVDGIINAQAGGTIGGWKINSDALVSADQAIGLRPESSNADTSCVVWAGNATPEQAPFQVWTDGTVKIHKGGLRLTTTGDMLDPVFGITTDSYCDINHEDCKIYSYWNNKVGTLDITTWEYAQIGQNINDFTKSSPGENSTLGMVIASSRKEIGSIITTGYTKFTQIIPDQICIGRWDTTVESGEASTLNRTILTYNGIESSGDLTINTDSNLTIGATNFSLTTPNATTTELKTNVSNLQFTLTTPSSWNNWLVISASGRQTTLTPHTGYQSDTSPVGHLAGTWTSDSNLGDSSDRNLKNSIEPLSDNYSVLFDSLNPVRFKYNSGTSNRYHTGFIAQEVADAIQTADLTTGDFAAYMYDADSDTRSIRYGEIIALCVNEIQKLKARVVELENKG